MREMSRIREIFLSRHPTSSNFFFLNPGTPSRVDFLPSGKGGCETAFYNFRETKILMKLFGILRNFSNLKELIFAKF